MFWPTENIKKIELWGSNRGDLLIAYITDNSMFCLTENNYGHNDPASYWHSAYKDLYYLERYCGYKFICEL